MNPNATAQESHGQQQPCSGRPIPGTDAYWRERRRAFALIRELEDAQDERGFIVWSYGLDMPLNDTAEREDRITRLAAQAADDPTVIEILTAQNRLALLKA